VSFGRRLPTGAAGDNSTGLQAARRALELAAIDFGRAGSTAVHLEQLGRAARVFHRAMCEQPDWNVDGGSVLDVTPAGWAYPLADVTAKVPT